MKILIKVVSLPLSVIVIYSITLLAILKFVR